MSSHSLGKPIEWMSLCHQRNGNEIRGRETIDLVWSSYKMYKQEQFCESDMI